MSENAGSDIKVQLRSDLSAAMKDRRTLDTKVIRALVAAIDNAEAPPVPPGTTAVPGQLSSRSAEVERLLLSRSEVRDVLLAEIREREHAAEELERLGVMDRAEALRAEAGFAKRYLE